MANRKCFRYACAFPLQYDLSHASKFTTRALLFANFVGIFYWGNSVVDTKVSLKGQLCL